MQVCLHGLISCDRSGNGDGEKRNVQQECEKVPFRLELAPGAVDEIRNRYGIKVYAAAAEKETLENPDINLSSQFGGGYTVKADEFLNDGQEIELLGEKVRCLLTPGHTKGGMCYYFTGSGILFSGDTLFQQSVGRTDFPGGSMGEIVRSIREKLFVLPDYVRVYTGHGMMTNIKDEKMLNPFAVE